MKKRVLITDGVHEIMPATFESKGYVVDYRPEITLAQSLDIIKNYHGAIINSKIKAHKNWLDAADNLEFIGRLGSGMEIIDVPYAKSQGIRVFSAPEGNRNAVAEHALGFLLALANQFLKGHYDVQRMQWDREGSRGFEVEGKTIGIIGFGNNGKQFAKKLSGLDMKVLAYDKYLNNYTAGMPHVTESSPSEIKAKADIISLHLPLTDETHHYINQRFIDECEKNIIVLNTARGKNIDTKALIAGLQSGKVLGAGLDVFENEKPSTFTTEEREMYQGLYKLDNVIFSPHVAGWTHESKYKIAKTLLDKIFETPTV